jgi:hypothetical protein
VVIAAVPTRIPEVTNGDSIIKWNHILFTVISAFTTQAFQRLFQKYFCFLNQSPTVPPERISPYESIHIAFAFLYLQSISKKFILKFHQKLPL